MPAIARLNLPNSPSVRVQRMLKGALRSPLLATPQSIYWPAEFFNLPQVELFRQCSAHEQQQIVAIANQDLLHEAYFVEKAGMGYMAQMGLMAETTEERMLYSLFAAEEAQHLAQVSALLSAVPLVKGQNGFLQLLGDLVDTGSKPLLLFVIQVVLEGWGLSHYRRLAQGCEDPQVAAMFQGFLEAESRHHGLGVVLWQEQAIWGQLDEVGRSQLLKLLAQFLQMVQVGPQGVLGAIAQVKGPLPAEQRRLILEQLDTVGHAQVRLDLLRSLIAQGCGDENGEILEALQGCFTPWSAAEAAQIGP
jgi:tRNA isopentenyl-2-thiomethyl-A-37 hydroxylase MiaE